MQFDQSGAYKAFSMTVTMFLVMQFVLLISLCSKKAVLLAFTCWFYNCRFDFVLLWDLQNVQQARVLTIKKQSITSYLILVTYPVKSACFLACVYV